jgi:hypothetical protein
MRIIEIPNQENAILMLKKAHYEMIGLQSIVQYMITSGAQSNPTFGKYWEEYINSIANYDKVKEEFRINYITPVVGENYPGNWEVDFFYNEVKIYD